MPPGPGAMVQYGCIYTLAAMQRGSGVTHQPTPVRTVGPSTSLPKTPAKRLTDSMPRVVNGPPRLVALSNAAKASFRRPAEDEGRMISRKCQPRLFG
jgi:hypothetical protein